MASLIITNGPFTSGKTTWAREWVSLDPSKRVRAGRMDEAIGLLNSGFDVVLDHERLTGHEVFVKRFINEEDNNDD